MPARKPLLPGKAHLIDQNADYPCPCRRQGELRPIALTDAFGCQRCQQIFVIKTEGYAIEELATIYPYRKRWYWNGKQWMIIRPSLVRQYWLLLLSVVGLLLVLSLVMIIIQYLGHSAHNILLAVVLVILMMLLVSHFLGGRR